MCFLYYCYFYNATHLVCQSAKIYFRMDNTHISQQHEQIKGMLTLFNGVEFDNFPWGDRPAPGYPYCP